MFGCPFFYTCLCVLSTPQTHILLNKAPVCVCVAMWAVEYEYVDNLPNKRPRSLCNNPAQSDTQASDVVNAMLELTNEVRQLRNVMAAENNEKRSRSHVVGQQQPVGVGNCELVARYAAQLANVQNEVKRILAANDALHEESDRLHIRITSGGLLFWVTYWMRGVWASHQMTRRVAVVAHHRSTICCG